MTSPVLHATREDATTRPPQSTGPAGIETTRRATIIASTMSGAHYLRTHMPKCGVAGCDGAGTVELVSRLDSVVRLLCLDHGLGRLDALDYGKRGAA